ncbi:MAG: 3-hydroxyacyl-ACP dehydratase FabZ family protein [Planctomycetota bacterium]|jgi:3-hydroxyacyl-[acyl-carrier-protein] dehydratase
MPREPLYDLSAIDFNKVEISQEEIYKVNAHRYEFMLLDGIFVSDFDKQVAVGYRDVRDDEFWVRGHIPGRPIFPGVLMIETAAQLVSYYAQTARGGDGFLGFAGVDNVKFRGSVVPGNRIIMMGKVIDLRARRCVGDTQAYVDGKLVYEGRITGMWL